MMMSKLSGDCLKERVNIKEIDWNDLESIKNHKPMIAFNRTKVFNKMISGELARRYVGKISSIAFDPASVIDKTDPGLKERWPSGTLKS